MRYYLAGSKLGSPHWDALEASGCEVLSTGEVTTNEFSSVSTAWVLWWLSVGSVNMHHLSFQTEPVGVAFSSSVA